VSASFHIENFGCRAARADGEAIADRLRAAGLSERQPSLADVVVINTCSVTAEADREARAFIRRAHRLNPNARIVATGCYAQRAPEELAALTGVAAVVGNSHKAFAPEVALSLIAPTAGRRTLAPQQRANGLIQIQPAPAETASPQVIWANDYIQTAQAELAAPQVLADDRFAHSFLEEAQLLPGAQTRPNLKIQEGCSNRCTFCVIPQTRGSSRSLPAETILRQIRGFVAAGGNELVLSGINLGRWGRDLASSSDADRPPLAGLVRAVLEQTDLPRLRLSSIEPMDWDANLVALMAEFGGMRLARHAHLPLQSGSDTVLRRMHRRYRPWHYADKVAALLRAAGSDLTLGADVMVGFPGETDGEFEETAELIRALPFGYLHLFPFSPRPGTPAWALYAARPVPAAVVEERMTALRALAAQKSGLHRSRFVGRELDAITLNTPDSQTSRGCTSALTENFLPIKVGASLPANRLIRVRVTGIASDGALLASEGACVPAPSDLLAAVYVAPPQATPGIGPMLYSGCAREPAAIP
jgi:threonylcarbamoyladenosine tRNA methylthiotransferase MtaB